MNLTLISRRHCGLLLALFVGIPKPDVHAAPEPAGWYAGDMHVHRSCGGNPVSVSTIYSAMVNQNLAVVSLLADMGNGEVLDPATDLPKVTGLDDPISTAGRIVHWDAEWHWDATYSQFEHQALGGHIVALGLTNASQIWQEYTYPILNWARLQGGIAGFAHMQYLDDGFPQTLNCCIPVEYPVEVALGACDFVSEDVAGSDTAMRAYYRLLNCGFRPGWAGGSDYPCNAQIGAVLTYVQVSGPLTYRKWIDGIANRRTVVSRNGHNEFLDFKVNGTSTPGDEILLTGSGSVSVTVQWLANQNLAGNIELVHNGVVVASQAASVSSSTSATLSTTVNISRSGWLAARRMGANGHQVHTAAVFVTVNGSPVRASVEDAQFYVQWMDNLLQRTSVGGVWASYFPTKRAEAQARYTAARNIFQQIATEAAASQPLTVATTSLPAGVVNASYSASLTASGGTTPYAWSIISGSLPPGLSMSSAGVISGTPTTTGTFNFTARVSDSSNPAQTASQALSILVGNSGGSGLIGNTIDGTSTDNIWDAGPWINAGRFLAPSNMTVTTMQAKVVAISGKYKCAIYTDSSGQPSRLLGHTVEVSNPATGWQVFALTTPVTLTSGNYYWLAIWSDNSNARVYYSDAGGTLRWNQYAYGSWPDPISTSGGGGLNYCIYASGSGATLEGVAVAPTSATIAAGASQQFTATGTYSDASTQDLTSQATWSSSSPAVANVNSSGLATGLAAGATTISASFNGKTGSGTLTVQAAALSITTATLPGGMVGAAYASTLTASGGTTPYAWSLSGGSTLPPGLALNPASGAITGTPTVAGNFNFTIQASDSSNPVQTTTKSFILAVAPALTAIAVTPASPSVAAGATQQMTATGTYSDGSTQNLTSQATWNSSSPAVATVSAAGLVTGVAAGSTTVTATSGGIAGGTTVTVLPPPEGLGDYRTVSSGLWNSAATWQTNNGAAWVAAARPPTNNAAAGVIRLRAGHTVTVSSAVTVDQVMVEAGGQLTVNNVTLTVANGAGSDLDVFGTVSLTGTSGTIAIGSGATISFQAGATYQHARSAGTIPTATWDVNSTCLITGSTSALPGGLGQIFGNVTWNCASQSSHLSLEGSVTGIAGDFTVMSTGSRSLRLANSSTARTLVVGGDFTQTGGTFVVVGSTGAGTLNVTRHVALSGGTFVLKQSGGNASLNVTGNFSQTGGTFNLRTSSTAGTGAVAVQGNFALTLGTFNLSSVGAVGTLSVAGNFTHTGGTMTETSSGSGAIVFNGFTPQTFVSGGTVANTINYTVNSGATLMLGTSLLGNGSSGTFTLASGATLGLGDPAGIATSGDTGNIRVTGTRTFNPGANYVYTGPAAQVPGNGLPATINNLTVSNPAGLTLNTTHTVNGVGRVSAGGRLLGTGRLNNGPLILEGMLSPGITIGRVTTARQTWNGGAVYEWEINDASGAPGVGWDLLSLTDGQGIQLQSATTNPFSLKLTTLNGSNPGLAANFNKTSSYTWPIAIATNASVTNFSADKVVVDTAGFVNDFAGGTFSLEQSGEQLRLLFTPAPAQLTISTATLPNGMENVAYTTTLTALGGAAPYSWSLISGALPPGLSLNAGSGAIIGTPTATGAFNFTVGVSDSSDPVQEATKTFILTIQPALTSLAVTPSNPVLLTGGAQQFSAIGTYSDATTQDLTALAAWNSSAPAVATINASGLAVGVAPGMTTVSATVGGITGNTLLTVQAPLVIVTGTLPNGTVNADYTTPLTASGGAAPYAWSVVSGALPSGLTLDSGSGVISGNPTTAGTSPLTIQVTDSSVPPKTATRSLTLTIASALTSIAVTPANPVILVGGSQQFSATGTYSDGSTQNLTAQATWVSSAPTIATINAGGMSAGVAAGNTTISATHNGISGQTLLTVQTAPPTITTTSLPGGVVNVAYTATLTASGGTTPYAWTLPVGTLPPGLVLNGSSGTISGSPTTSGTYNFTARVTDASEPAQTAERGLSVTIASAGGPPGLIGNTAEGTLTDYLWYNGPWINAGRFQAYSNLTVTSIQAKVAAITGRYKCAIYSDNAGQPNRLLRISSEVSNPSTGWQTFPLTVSQSLTNGQHYWLAIWSDHAGAQVYYSGTTGTLSWQQLNYGNWPDPMVASGGGNLNYCIYATGHGPIYFGVASVTPAAGASGVNLGTPVSATFSTDMNASTINENTVLLRDPLNNLVAATVNYSPATRTATLTPNGGLKPSTTYTAIVKGGAGGVASLTGNTMISDFSWTFTSDMYGDGPGGPILIVTHPTNSFSRYYAEILLTEGLNAFALTNLASVSSATLANYDVVILGQAALSAAQVAMFTDWVNAGGKLIAMRPDKQLAGLLGLTDAGTTLAEGYLLVNTASGPGAGIVGQTIQFHGVADRYVLGGASSLATLYSNAQTPTANPAVTLRSVGGNGGQAAAFTFDLARSIVLTRQGNPAWTGQERDGIAPLRSDDLFYGPASFDPQPDWVNLNKVAIPQADEQQRLLANMILSMASTRTLLPRFWYFPRGHAALVVMTGDDHGNNGTAGRFDQYLAVSPAGGSVADWEAIRATSYIYPTTPMTDAQAAAYRDAGFEIGLHLTTGCANYTADSLAGFFAQQLSEFSARFPSLPSPTTHRMHCIAWSGYTILPEVGLQFGIRLDTSYYYYPPSWVADRPGLFNGSGMAMRFATTNGNVIDVYQAATPMTDESGQTYPYTINALLDRALGPEGFYGAFVANMHTDANTPTTPGQIGSDAIVSSAMVRGVPVISARQLLTWLDARNSSAFKSIQWNNGSQTFSVEASAAARGLQAMLPVPAAYNLGSLRFNGSPIPFELKAIKGIRYAFFEARSGSYQADLVVDGSPPTVTSTQPASGATGVSLTPQVRVVFSEAMDPGSINSSTVLLLDSSGNPVSTAVTYDPVTTTAILTPVGSLTPSRTYTAGVAGGASGVRDFAGNPMSADHVWSFTTTGQASYSLWQPPVVPGLVDGGADSPVQVGVKFRSDVAGSITGIRFYKSAANSGTHVGSLWTSTGTRLASATFTGETASGWQQVNFATPVTIAANTIYIASYHTTVGHYGADVNYFALAGVDNPPLRAPASGASGGNGVYRYGTSSVFPDLTWNAANYWVDVVFVPTAP